MKFIAILFSFLISSLSFLFFSSPVQAQTKTWASQQSGVCVKSVTVNPNGLGEVTYDDVATVQGAECLFFNILQVIVFIAGIAFLFMFISGGFKYLFSSGEQKAVAAASSTLTMAFIGIIGIIASWLIISFIQKFTGINITNFVIPS